MFSRFCTRAPLPARPIFSHSFFTARSAPLPTHASLLQRAGLSFRQYATHSSLPRPRLSTSNSSPSNTTYITFALSFSALTSYAAFKYDNSSLNLTATVNRLTGLSLSSQSLTLFALIGTNLVVFAAWQNPALRARVMPRWFLTSAGSHPVTLLTSTFSHAEFWHLGLNMVGLYSFGGSMITAMGAPHFTAFYLSSGVLASLISHLFRTSSLRLASASTHTSSLGASGALYSLLALTAYYYPSTSVSLLFVPFVAFPLKFFMPGLMAMDVAGILGRWGRFDHVAHLGGAVVGFGWAMMGVPMWLSAKKEVVRRKIKERNERVWRGERWE
ncbi:rhomboid-domain-containing protein [Saitoella complicata NRRL Y-17804]|uniref:Peptidase S54 rhomboid domain-containing protein n=1 Tax=Saitoella complicata (strain BCRC 22490 / CBS 7301 / JCM 7358 / NBRC 10748 / NRRL Y-17804) TaxID=698492 RepID=A0A0E9NNX2_SAICN|nr:rhomboid-domain-containing protein [Saitoella complicata NRRL Y-17804]ODQ55981.1 rhomboid-domain-containing protein [Saitoella complicata NRRL Y-17804]GAO51534.1 hypothetical protein G7K_5633-t1 [Saitoella complicata NRRL Y-17804]